MVAYISGMRAAVRWPIPYLASALDVSEDELARFADKDADGITVTSHDVRFREAGRRVRSTALRLPPGAIVKRYGEWIASPELVFLELAGKIPFHQQVSLGLQLCAHPPGKPEQAVSSKQKIVSLLKDAPGHIGYRSALRAANYIENGSGSIMESFAFMALTLPNMRGGYGLSGAVLNPAIELSPEGQKRLKQRHCFPDIYYAKEKVAVEYQSLAFHATPKQQGKDMVRATALELQGITVLHMTTVQLHDEDNCRDFAHHLARCLGRRIQFRTARFATQHQQLRKLLSKAETAYTSDAAASRMGQERGSDVQLRSHGAQARRPQPAAAVRPQGM